MPVLRGGVRRGRREPQPVPNNEDYNNQNQNNHNSEAIEENAAIATRTRRRRRAAAAAVAAPVDDNIVAAPGAANEIREVPEREERVLGQPEWREQVGERPMDDFGSGGADKANADESVSAPLPERVRILSRIFFMHYIYKIIWGAIVSRFLYCTCSQII